jgi:hypothetical protein
MRWAMHIAVTGDMRNGTPSSRKTNKCIEINLKKKDGLQNCFFPSSFLLLVRLIVMLEELRGFIPSHGEPMGIEILSSISFLFLIKSEISGKPII